MVAFLFSQPEKMVKALGIVPPGEQTVTPRIIQWFGYYLILMSILQFGAAAVLLHQSILNSIPSIQILLVLACIFITVSRLLYQSLIHRKGKLNSILYLWLSILFLGGLILSQTGISGTLIPDSEGNNFGGLVFTSIDFLLRLSSHMTFGIYIAILAAYIVGLFLTVIGTIFSWNDLRRWLYR